MGRGNLAQTWKFSTQKDQLDPVLSIIMQLCVLCAHLPVYFVYIQFWPLCRRSTSEGGLTYVAETLGDGLGVTYCRELSNITQLSSS